VLVVASDLAEEAPVWWLRVNAAARRGATLVVANARPTKLDRRAAFKLRYAYGGEVSLLNDLLAAVLDGGFENKDFLAARVDGFDELRRQLAQAPARQDLAGAAQAVAQAQNLVVIYGSDGLSYAGGGPWPRPPRICSSRPGMPAGRTTASWPSGRTTTPRAPGTWACARTCCPATCPPRRTGSALRPCSPATQGARALHRGRRPGRR